MQLKITVSEFETPDGMDLPKFVAESLDDVIKAADGWN